jgi:protein SCO1/2
MKTKFSLLILLALPLLFSGCSSSGGEQNGKLPILGNRHVEEVNKDGKTVQDTVYHTIADFSFTNQEGKTITNQYVAGKVYVADFFFTTCPTICPIMKKEMLRVFEKYKDNPNFKILSHSIDPTYDTQEVLNDYSKKLGIEDATTWNFLTGEPEKIYEIGQTSYLTTAMEDQAEPGGFLHSGAFVLVDKQGHIRAVYDGTKSDQVDQLIRDIPSLLEE